MTILQTNPTPPKREVYRWLFGFAKSPSFWILSGLLIALGPFVLYGGALFWQIHQLSSYAASFIPEHHSQRSNPQSRSMGYGMVCPHTSSNTMVTWALIGKRQSFGTLVSPQP
jgi:hypothetical protein